ncbi:MAG: PAS domain S-box protein [Candidatus Thorarchaeota archaeon]|nr:PAS domain S-box protein [Candidatus Thorarchaeota archaeon]
MQDESRNSSSGELTQKEEASRYRVLVESMNDGFGIIDKEGIFTYVNLRFARMLAYEPDDMVGKTLVTFLDEVNKKILRENIRQRQRGASTQYELAWTRSTGEQIPTIVSGAPLLDDDGKHIGSFAVITDITELKASRKALEESTEMLKRIFEESPVGIEIFDAEGVLTTANKAALEIGGLKDINDLIGFSLFDDPNLPKEMKARLIRGESVEFEAILDFDRVNEMKLYPTLRSGKIVLESWIKPLGLENNGGFKGYLSQIIEKTEHRAAEAALVDSEKRYQLLAENVTDVIFTTDLELNLTYVSTSVDHLLGYSAEELAGQSMIEFMSPDSVWLAIETMKESLEDERLGQHTQPRGESPPLEIRLKHKNGQALWVEITRTFLRDDEGRPTGVLGVARNIEERKEAEKALRDSEMKYRTLVDQSFQGIMIIQAIPLSIKYTNPAFANFLESSIEEVLAFSPKDIQNMVHPEDWNLLMNRLQALMSGEAPAKIPIVVRIFQKDGDMQWLEMFGRKVEYEETAAIQLVAINVTEKIHAERSIQTQKERAILYLDLMSHDFRNQLQIILGSTMVMETKLPDPEARRLLDQIVSAVERCQSMISKVKVTEPLMSVPLHPRKLNPAIESVVDAQRELHRDVDIELQLKVKNAIVDADQFLEKLLENIIENAIEHNPNAERKVWITLTKSGDEYKISISDNGHGISESVKSAIFDLSRRYGGVGLHQSKQICEKYGGRIDVGDRIESNPGEGAEFIIWLPMMKE